VRLGDGRSAPSLYCWYVWNRGLIHSVIAPTRIRISKLQHYPAETLERLREERADEVGLQAARLGHFHLLFHSEEPLDAHGFPCERVALEEFFDVAAVEGGVDAVRVTGANLGLVVVADGIEKEVLEALFLEHLIENVEYASLKLSLIVLSLVSRR
jgi:hypothetical protein